IRRSRRALAASRPEANRRLIRKACCLRAIATAAELFLRRIGTIGSLSNLNCRTQCGNLAARATPLLAVNPFWMQAKPPWTPLFVEVEHAFGQHHRRPADPGMAQLSLFGIELQFNE